MPLFALALWMNFTCLYFFFFTPGTYTPLLRTISDHWIIYDHQLLLHLLNPSGRLLRVKARSGAYYRKEPNNPVCWGIRLGQTNYWSSRPRAAHLLTALLTIPSHSLATYQDGKEVASHQNYLWAPFLTAQFNHFSWSLVSDQGPQLI